MFTASNFQTTTTCCPCIILIYYIYYKYRFFFKEKLSKNPKDKRNLFLLRAGFVRPGTTAAAGMSETDADKRARLAIAAREKLKNLHMYVLFLRFVAPTT